MVLIPLNLQASEFEDDLPSLLVTNGVSTEMESLSPSRTDESDEVLRKFKSHWLIFFFTQSTLAYIIFSLVLTGD